MKDRVSSVQLHVGKNQARINTEMLAGTMHRIAAQTYRKILVRDLDNGSGYDFQNRGSGVTDTLRAHYVEVRRIAAVPGDQEWWPRNLLSAISVMVPRTDSAGAALTAPPATR